MQVLFELSLLCSRAQREKEWVSEGDTEREERKRERQTKGKLCNIVGVHLFFFFNYNRDCIDVSGHMSSIIYQEGDC